MPKFIISPKKKPKTTPKIEIIPKAIVPYTKAKNVAKDFKIVRRKQPTSFII